MHGYAYVDEDGNIDVDTVTSTKEAAMVNAISTATYGNVIPTNDHTAEDIQMMFLDATGGHGSIEKVTIKIQGS